MVNKNLLKRLEEFGFGLFKAETGGKDASTMFADVVRSRDMRLWEGFPAVLANGAARGLFGYGKILSRFEKPLDKANFKSLLAMSLALYKIAGVKFAWADSLHSSLDKDAKKECDLLSYRLKHKDKFKIGGYEMSTARLKTVFSNYFVGSGTQISTLLTTKEDLALEYALSQMFSAKQKELFLKKVKGEKLIKTEREYYSRVVKKKVIALANPRLHNLARKLLMAD